MLNKKARNDMHSVLFLLPKLCVGSLMLLQRAGELIRAGRAAHAALNALETADGLFDLHALHQRGDTLGGFMQVMVAL